MIFNFSIQVYLIYCYPIEFLYAFFQTNKCLCEGVIVPTALYGAEACDMRFAERTKVIVLEMKCLRSLVAVA